MIYLQGEDIIGMDLNLISFLAILSSILVISTNNAVISVLFLISLFINVAIYLILMGVTFIGLVYIVVYVGAVTILFLFVIMLLDIKFNEIKDYNNSDSFPLGIVIGLTFLYPLINIIPKESYNIKSSIFLLFNNITFLLTGEKYNELNNISDINNGENTLNLNENLPQTFKIIINLWDNSLNSSLHISSIGQVMYNSHLIWFIAVSLILLLAMVGAIALTLKPKI